MVYMTYSMLNLAGLAKKAAVQKITAHNSSGIAWYTHDMEVQV